jgi:hypothetical protein
MQYLKLEDIDHSQRTAPSATRGEPNKDSSHIDPKSIDSVLERVRRCQFDQVQFTRALIAFFMRSW